MQKQLYPIEVEKLNIFKRLIDKLFTETNDHKIMCKCTRMIMYYRVPSIVKCKGCGRKYFLALSLNEVESIIKTGKK